MSCLYVYLCVSVCVCVFIGFGRGACVCTCLPDSRFVCLGFYQCFACRYTTVAICDWPSQDVVCAAGSADLDEWLAQAGVT